MTIITVFKEAMKLERSRRQPSLAFLPFSVPTLLDDITTSFFPDITHAVKVYFVDCGPLACIIFGDTSATIYIHQLLNNTDTPKEVVTLIIKHELLHLRIPPRTIKGREVDHPPEFWEAERLIAPERNQAWRWMWANFMTCLKRRPRLERIDVLPSWKRAWSGHRPNLAMYQQLLEIGDDDESGWL